MAKFDIRSALIPKQDRDGKRVYNFVPVSSHRHLRRLVNGTRPSRATFLIVALLLSCSVMFVFKGVRAIAFPQQPATSLLAGFSYADSLAYVQRRSRVRGAPDDEINVQRNGTRRGVQQKMRQRPRRKFEFTSAADELGALVGFLSAFASNSLPNYMDPMQRLNPDLVLEFDARSPTARQDARAWVEDVWAKNPVVLFSELVSGRPKQSRSLKELFKAYQMHPPATVIEVDQREDSAVLRPLLTRLTGSNDLPLIIIGGTPVLGVESVFALNHTGTLKDMLLGAGATIKH